MRRRRLAAQQQAPQIRFDQLGPLLKLPPGDPDHAPARGLEPPIARTVELEGVRGRVAGVAVQLDDQPLLGPQAVDLVALDHHIGLRTRETGRDEEVLEALLELAADGTGADRGLCMQGANRLEAWAARVARYEVMQRERVGEPALLRSPQRAASFMALNDST